ncbi:MAG TPA: efflux RND transporter periplasmic adaptor subunit [Candidatus Aquilonibacter sp.]|nr:efflux RND transporter periplasmic adaptor subunit [Candidatus Aquilonibacter sp.]
MKRMLVALALVSLSSVMLLVGCGDSAGSGQDPTGSGAIARPKDTAAIPVLVAKVSRTSIPLELQAIGTGQASQTVSVESQVPGIVKEVDYHPGQAVKKGDLLVSLDESPFLAALAQAQGTLNRDQAQAQLNKEELHRYNELFQAGVVSQEQYDQYLATSNASNATVAADEAAVQTAKINLSYCSIYAPIGGVTGAQLISPGTTVTANNLPVLVVINQVSPIFVKFAVPQQYLESVKDLMARSRLAVQATPPSDSVPENGVLTFVDNAVDPTTGTIDLMGTFPNDDERLWPGQFSNVSLKLNEQQNVLVVPAPAVQTGQQGTYVFVLKPDMTVGVQQVKVGQTVNDQSEILAGLSEGETVVTDGQVRLVPGSKVYVAKGL